MKNALLFVVLIVFGACSVSKKSVLTKNELSTAVAESPVFSKSLTGFLLQDAKSEKILAEFNSGRCFTPASNTKILTLFSSLAFLKDSLIAFEWQTDETTFFIRGTGDPTFLHDQLGRLSPAFSFLKNRPEPTVCLLEQRFFDQRFGRGWMWDDYEGAYQCERSAMPMYSNLMAARGAEPKIFPIRLNEKIRPIEDASLPAGILGREEFSNRLLVRRETFFANDFEQFLPIRWEEGLLPKLLEDTLKTKKVRIATKSDEAFLNTGKWKKQIGAPTDSVLRAMMLPSDNFLAEQLMLQIGGILTDSLSVEKAIEQTKQLHFADFQDRIKWVDGSGVSRYNLVSPQFLCFLLEKMWKNEPRERLLNFFPAGGESGTIKDWYKSPDGSPYVFAKTGTMSGVHSLSGYVRTKSGRWLIFSFMHDHFIGSSKPYKEEMQRILERIYQAY